MTAVEYRGVVRKEGRRWYWEVVERNDYGEFGLLTDHGRAFTWQQAMKEVAWWVYDTPASEMIAS